MKALKRVFSLMIGMFLTIGAGIFFSSCSEKDKKRDVTIIIFDDLGNSFEFPPDVKELRTTRTYDGESHFYGIRYTYPGDNNIYEPHGSGDDIFVATWLYTAPDGTQDSTVRRVEKVGEYSISVGTDSINLWKTRYVFLYVTVEE